MENTTQLGCRSQSPTDGPSGLGGIAIGDGLAPLGSSDADDHEVEWDNFWLATPRLANLGLWIGDARKAGLEANAALRA